MLYHIPGKGYACVKGVAYKVNRQLCYTVAAVLKVPDQQVVSRHWRSSINDGNSQYNDFKSVKCTRVVFTLSLIAPMTNLSFVFTKTDIITPQGLINRSNEEIIIYGPIDFASCCRK